MTKLFELCFRADRIQSKIAKRRASLETKQKDGQSTKGCRTKSLHRALLSIYERIRNLVTDLHWKVASWLCHSYDVIILPRFDTKTMVSRGSSHGKRRMNSKTARSMCTWSHYLFRQRLAHKVSEFPGTTLVICTEEYTSKTCGRCGEIHRNLGGSKTFHCPSCGLVADRDAHAARNIFIKTLACGVGGTPRV
jgi:putative transposase